MRMVIDVGIVPGPIPGKFRKIPGKLPGKLVSRVRMAGLRRTLRRIGPGGRVEVLPRVVGRVGPGGPTARSAECCEKRTFRIFHFPAREGLIVRVGPSTIKPPAPPKAARKTNPLTQVLSSGSQKRPRALVCGHVQTFDGLPPVARRMFAHGRKRALSAVFANHWTKPGLEGLSYAPPSAAP